MEGKKLLVLGCVFWSVFYSTECARRNDTRRWRRGTCPEGLYRTSDGSECCLCPKGTYLVNDCTSSLTKSECAVCEVGTYQDHAHSERNCEPCKTCGINDNKVEEKRCTNSSNTVCRCQDGHYCDKGNECKVCYPCSTCDELGINVPCSITNNTQCNEKPPEGTQGHKTLLAIVVLVIVTVLVLLIVYFLWKKKLLCFKPLENLENPESSDLLDDPDLHEVLPKISELLGFRVVRMVVRRQGVLSQTAIDNIMDEYPRDASERAYQLLKAWYEKHGMRGASKELCDNLMAISMRSKAEAVRELIKTQQHNREVEENGNV